MSVELLLNELHKVRKSGADSWMACCPAHDDKSPSLSVKEVAGGDILIHCFAGCEPHDILAAVGLKMADFWPDRDQHSYNDEPFHPPKRETRSEADLAHIQIRYLTAEAMVEAKQRLTPGDQKIALADFKYLKEIGKLP